MRLTTPRTGVKQSDHRATGRLWRGWLGGVWLCIGVTLCAVCIRAAPAGSGTPAPRPHHGSGNNSGGPAPESAVVYDDNYRPPAKDLLLGLDAERKAEAAARFMHGLMLEDTADADHAESEYLKALALDPGNAELSVKVAWDDLRRGDTPGAINLLKDTIKAAPKLPQPYIALAYLYYNNLNKPDLAQKYVLQALDADPGNILAYEYLREIYKATNQSAKIPALLDRAAKADSKDASYWLHLGVLFRDCYLGDDPAKAGDDLKKVTLIYQKALATGNDSVDVVAQIADFYVSIKQYADAIPLYQRVIELDPSLNAPREHLASCYRETSAPQKAAETLEALIKLNPVQSRAYEVLGKIYEEAGQYEKALADYEQSLLVSPDDISGYENVALTLLEKFKQPQKAVPVLAEARRRFPDRPGFTYLLAVALEQSKQHQQALTTFEQAEIEAEKLQPSLLTGQFYFEFGSAAEQAGLYDKAALLMKKSLGLNDNPQLVALTCNYLGYMWVDRNQNLEEAGDLIKRALEIDPDNGMYLDSLGWYYYRTSHFDQALVHLSRAVEAIKPEDPTVLEHLGDTYLKLNDTAKAVGCWQKAVEKAQGMDPADPNIAQLNKKIAETKVTSNPPPSPAPPKG